MEVIINNHVYWLSARETVSNPDYIVQLGGAGTDPIIGMLVWEGNGLTNFRYRAIDMYGELIGGADGYTAALALLDKLVYP